MNPVPHRAWPRWACRPPAPGIDSVLRLAEARAAAGTLRRRNDWQVIRDLDVLDALKKQGDDPSVKREISHWAYFPDEPKAQAFASWARGASYKVGKVERTGDQKVVVRFTHVGSMELADITHHSIEINRKAKEIGGDYDGWETSVEHRP